LGFDAKKHLKPVDFIVKYFIFAFTVTYLFKHLFSQIFKVIEALFGFELVDFEIEIDYFEEFANHLVMNGSVGEL
jgi:hypothetical protein